MYKATDKVTAGRFLEIWLGLTLDPKLQELGKFPRKLPPKLRKTISEQCRVKVITQNGKFIYQLTNPNTAPDLHRLVAEKTVDYLEHHPAQLDKALKETLTPYLTVNGQEKIARLLRPPMPGPLPAEPEAILTWFRHQYLPARQWQMNYGKEADRNQLNATAQQFAQWYVDQYPQALYGNNLQKHLSFKRTAANGSHPAYVTLLIVLDGLHVGDARRLLEKIKEQIPRLTLSADELAFAPIPTITEICKPALFTGQSPELAAQRPPLGQVLPENEIPIAPLGQASPGRVYFWRIQEPDHTYHQKNSADTLPQEIEGQLYTVAKKMKELVEKLPAEIPLRFVLTSDHGRLLARSERKLDVPAGMSSQGRAALGQINQTFPPSGYIRANHTTLYLHAKRFGLPQDAALAFNDETFRTNDGKTGNEHYPHGGLYPEEVIIPWLELIRDQTLPQLTITLTGNGPAGQTGQLSLQLRNPENIPLTIATLILTINHQTAHFPIHQTLAPYSEQTLSLSHAPWPNAAQASQTTAQLTIQRPNNPPHQLTIEKPTLTSTEMYQRQEDILGDLDL